MEQFVTAAQAATIIGVSRRRIHQLIADGLLTEAGRVGNAVVLQRSQVERLAETGWPGRRPKPS